MAVWYSSPTALLVDFCIETSVTSKKLANVNKCCPKMKSLEKCKIWHLYKKFPKKCGQFGQNNCCHRLWKVAQSAINIPIWSHWSQTTPATLQIESHRAVECAYLYYMITCWPIFTACKNTKSVSPNLAGAFLIFLKLINLFYTQSWVAIECKKTFAMNNLMFDYTKMA